MSRLVAQRVGDAWVETDDRAEDLNPSKLSDVVAEVAQANANVASAAIDAAADAFPKWRRTPMVERGLILARAATLLRERAGVIATDIAREMGKTLGEATGEVGKAADFFDYYAGVARFPYGELLSDGRANTVSSSRREPVGVVVAITPWNDPILTPARKLGPALVSGNTIVLKPAADSPLAAYHLVTAILDAGAPAGVINLVLGRSSVVGPVLLDHPRTAALTFTGSTEVGYSLQRQLAGRAVRVQTELGGKNAAVVLADADLDLAVAALMDGAFRQAGQRCTATSRIIAAREVYDELLERLEAATAAIRVGPALDATTGMGPVVSSAQLEAVLRHVREAREDGATVVAGGENVSEGALADGCFMQPTILADVDDEMRIWRNEVFGPVIALRSVDDFDSAVAAANDSSYGLAAAVFTKDLEHAERFIDEVDAGQISVNLPTPGWDVHLPFGGFKDSGSPFKEQGLPGLQFYTRIKTAAVRRAA